MNDDLKFWLLFGAPFGVIAWCLAAAMIAALILLLKGQ